MPQAFIVVKQQKKGAREVCSRRGAKRGPANIRWVTPGLPVTIRRETASPPQSEAVNPSASTADSLTAPPCAAGAAAHSRARLRREPSWRLNWRPDSLTRCASACSRNPPMRTCMRARGCNGEAFCKGWVSGRAAGRCWHGGADSPRNRAVPARQAQQVRARSRTPTHGTNSRSLGPRRPCYPCRYPCLSVSIRAAALRLCTHAPSPQAGCAEPTDNARHGAPGAGAALVQPDGQRAAFQLGAVELLYGRLRVLRAAEAHQAVPLPPREPRGERAARPDWKRRRAGSAMLVICRAGPCFCSCRDRVQCVHCFTTKKALCKTPCGLPAAAPRRADALELAAADLRAFWQLPCRQLPCQAGRSPSSPFSTWPRDVQGTA